MPLQDVVVDFVRAVSELWNFGKQTAMVHANDVATCGHLVV